MGKRFLVGSTAVAAVLLVAGGVVGFNLVRDKAIADHFATMRAPSTSVSAVQAKPVSWRPGLDAIGTVKAAHGVDVAVEVSGVVQSIGFAANGHVKQGDVLLQLDDASERADVVAAVAALRRDEAHLDRILSLVRSGSATEAARDQALATVSASKSALDRLNVMLAKKAVRAPFAGTVGIPRLDVGQYVQPGQMVATLQAMTTMKVDFQVPEQDAPLLMLGQGVRFGTRVADLPFSGTVTGIDPKADPATRLVAVQAEVSNPQGLLRPGEFVRVRVDLPVEEGVVVVPQTAVMSSLYGDFVYVVVPLEKNPVQVSASPVSSVPVTRDLVARQVFVQLGRRDSAVVEVLGGVRPGDLIVVAGQNKIDNNAAVRVDNTVDLSAVGNGPRG